MYHSVHFSAECFPIAKVGGLGDVVGALPKYLTQEGFNSCVIMPKYNQKWAQTHSTKEVHYGFIQAENFKFTYYIQQFENTELGYDLFVVDIPDMLFREQVYGYNDDHLRFLFYQQAALDWLCSWEHKPGVLHCHDHHTGLISFIINNCYSYISLRGIKTVFTIHNGLYTGSFPSNNAKYFPSFPASASGLLEWDDMICPLATGIKCSNFVTTVSVGYLEELKQTNTSLNWLYNEYWFKEKGIVNGIDTEVWNPASDPSLTNHFNGNWEQFKHTNKAEICSQMNLNPTLPLTVFIGRLNTEKGGDVLTQGIKSFAENNKNMNFYILGSGANNIEDDIRLLSNYFPNNVVNYIGYNEALAHQLYAAADFLIMPSLVEPCGLNQLYALRYATMPIVRSIGGLKDTVIDFGDEGGYGIRFDQATSSDVVMSLYRALELYNDKNKLNELRQKMVSLDFSWTKVIQQYIAIYNN